MIVVNKRLNHYDILRVTTHNHTAVYGGARQSISDQMWSQIGAARRRHSESTRGVHSPLHVADLRAAPGT